MIGQRTFDMVRRIVPPFVTQAAEALRLRFGADPIDHLIGEHRQVVAMLARLEHATDATTAGRMALFLAVKRALTKHSLAEEDVVYPILHDDVHDEEGSLNLYEEHADIKIHLFEAERAIMRDAAWLEPVRALRGVLEEHIRHEEEVEFPKLQRMMDRTRARTMSLGIRREEAMVI
jgi:iron-sulfur cluster repair protein YtfE (RIC family)